MKPKALWVDDEPAAVSYERIVVEGLGLEVSLALTADEALDMSRDTCFRFVLLDLILPKDEYGRARGIVDAEAGLSVLTNLRDPKRNAATDHNVRVLVVTAVVSAEFQTRALLSLKDPRDYLTNTTTLRKLKKPQAASR